MELRLQTTDVGDEEHCLDLALACCSALEQRCGMECEDESDDEEEDELE